MPNWAEGSLKLRGKKENIAQALKYMFCTDNDVEIEEDFEIGIVRINNHSTLFLYQWYKKEPLFKIIN